MLRLHSIGSDAPAAALAAGVPMGVGPVAWSSGVTLQISQIGGVDTADVVLGVVVLLVLGALALRYWRRRGSAEEEEAVSGDWVVLPVSSEPKDAGIRPAPRTEPHPHAPGQPPVQPPVQPSHPYGYDPRWSGAPPAPGQGGSQGPAVPPPGYPPQPYPGQWTGQPGYHPTPPYPYGQSQPYPQPQSPPGPAPPRSDTPRFQAPPDRVPVSPPTGVPAQPVSNNGLAPDGTIPEGETIDAGQVRFHRPPEGTLQLLPGRLDVVGGDPGRDGIRFVKIPAVEPEVTFGRSAGPQYRHIQLKIPTVSRMHARMWFRERNWWIENLSETNPVVVNGQPLPSGTDGVRSLQDGDRIEMGEVVFRYWA